MTTSIAGTPPLPDIAFCDDGSFTHAEHCSWSLDLRTGQLSWWQHTPHFQANSGFAPTLHDALNRIVLSDRAKVVLAGLSSVRDAASKSLEIGVTTAAGEQKRTRLTIYPFSERFGMATLLAGTMEDCLDQGRTASNVNVPLEEVVAALTADVREWALFGCSVPHELGSLVAAISAFSRTLEETEGGLLSPQGRGYLHLIQKTAAQMSEISRALLTIAPLSSRPLVTQTTDLTELAWSAIEQLRSTDTTRKVTFKVQPDLHADGEPQLLERVLCNLLSNAWEFTATEDAAVISLRGKHDGQTMVYAVDDNGIGFDMQDAENVFSAFHQLQTGPRLKGNGIGLALARRIVERHGGRMWATAEPGQGATFFFTLEPRRAQYHFASP
jgi:signal transduction histidine kinase